jgi:hypothetical protein
VQWVESPNLDLFGKYWISLEKIGIFWTKLEKIRKNWNNFEIFGK